MSFFEVLVKKQSKSYKLNIRNKYFYCSKQLNELDN